MPVPTIFDTCRPREDVLQRAIHPRRVLTALRFLLTEPKR